MCFCFLSFPFFSYFSLYYRTPSPKSGDSASGDMTVFFRVWLSGRDDFRKEWYNSTVVWVKIIYLFVIRGCYLLLTMEAGGVHAFMDCSFRIDWSEEVKPLLCESEEQGDGFFKGVDHGVRQTCLGQGRYFGC